MTGFMAANQRALSRCHCNKLKQNLAIILHLQDQNTLHQLLPAQKFKKRKKKTNQKYEGKDYCETLIQKTP